MLAERVGYLLAKLHHRFAGESIAALAEAGVGLSGMHFGALSIVDGLGPMSQQALGEYIGKDRTTIVAIVDELEHAGLVERRRNPADRRAYALEVTTKGHDWLARAKPSPARRRGRPAGTARRGRAGGPHGAAAAGAVQPAPRALRLGARSRPQGDRRRVRRRFRRRARPPRVDRSLPAQRPRVALADLPGERPRRLRRWAGSRPACRSGCRSPPIAGRCSEPASAAR